MHEHRVLHRQSLIESQIKVCAPVDKATNGFTERFGRPLDMDDITFGILRELSSIPPALKAWRAIVAEILNDNRFFNSLPEAGEQFRPITKAFIDADKTAFPELLGPFNLASDCLQPLII